MITVAMESSCMSCGHTSPRCLGEEAAPEGGDNLHLHLHLPTRYLGRAFKAGMKMKTKKKTKSRNTRSDRPQRSCELVDTITCSAAGKNDANVGLEFVHVPRELGRTHAHGLGQVDFVDHDNIRTEEHVRMLTDHMGTFGDADDDDAR